jgi:hypothetical protein
MTASVQSPADVVNLALVILGHPHRVGNLYEGSEAAKAALTIYAESRDEVLRAKDWPFALRQVAGTAGSTTVSGWAYSWTFPADCLRVRSVAPQTIPSPNYDPQPVQWTIFNDQTATPPKKVVLSNISPVNLNYTGQITDMTTWEPLFVNAVAQVLATKLAPNLVKQIAPALDPLGAITEAAMSDEMQAPEDAAMQSDPQPTQRRREGER